MSNVDVIIPVFKTGEYLEDLIKSMALLDLGEHKVMFNFVFDYSDRQREDFEAFQVAWQTHKDQIYSNNPGKVSIQVTFNKENLGLAGTRNAGIANTVSEYIIWMDSDDVFTSASIKERVDFMNANPNVDFAYGSYTTFKNVNGGSLFTTTYMFGDPNIQPFDYGKVLEANQFSTCAGIIRRDKFIPFDQTARVAEDYVWVLNHLHEYNWAFIPNLYCFYYRIRPDSLSNDPESQKLHYANVIGAKRKAYKNLKNLGMLPPQFSITGK